MFHIIYYTDTSIDNYFLVDDTTRECSYSSRHSIAEAVYETHFDSYSKGSPVDVATSRGKSSSSHVEITRLYSFKSIDKFINEYPELFI